MDVVERIRRVVDELRLRGLTVEYVPGWETRGKGPMVRVVGQLDHHDAIAGGPNAGLRVCTFGRPGLSNSLCMFYVGRAGTIFVVAAGVSWHAGRGLFASNSYWSGIEAANDGRGEPWPAVQLFAFDTLNAVCSEIFGFPVDNVRDHKEHAPSRKIDRAGLDPEERRRSVARLRGRRRIVLPVLAQGSQGDYVRALKALLNEKCGWNLQSTNGSFGPTMTQKVKEFQRFFQLVDDGVVGPRTWETLLALPVR